MVGRCEKEQQQQQRQSVSKIPDSLSKVNRKHFQGRENTKLQIRDSLRENIYNIDDGEKINIHKTRIATK